MTGKFFERRSGYPANNEKCLNLSYAQTARPRRDCGAMAIQPTKVGTSHCHLTIFSVPCNLAMCHRACLDSWSLLSGSNLRFMSAGRHVHASKITGYLRIACIVCQLLLIYLMSYPTKHTTQCANTTHCTHIYISFELPTDHSNSYLLAHISVITPHLQVHLSPAPTHIWFYFKSLRFTTALSTLEKVSCAHLAVPMSHIFFKSCFLFYLVSRMSS